VSALSIAVGSWAQSVDGESVSVTNELLAKVQALKTQAASGILIDLSLPPFVATFYARPFGLSVAFSQSLGQCVVDKVHGAAQIKGLRPGATMTNIGGRDACSMQPDDVVGLLQRARLPVDMTFAPVWSVDDGEFSSEMAS